MEIIDKSYRHLGINTDLGMDPNSIPYPVLIRTIMTMYLEIAVLILHTHGLYRLMRLLFMEIYISINSRLCLMHPHHNTNSPSEVLNCCQ